MYCLSRIALGGHFGPAGISENRFLGGGRRSETDWNEVGMQIAFAGGFYPLFIAASIFFTAMIYALSLGSSIWTPSVKAVVLQLGALVAAGFPFLLFSGFLVSTLIAVPLTSMAAWLVRCIQVKISPACVAVFGVAVIASAWTLLAGWVASWSVPWI